jgi:protein-disulfide isomerase
MIQGTRRRGWAAPLLAGVMAMLATASACAQRGGTRTAAGAGGAMPTQDSILARASRGRQQGADSAKVTLIEISDFECPYCRRFFDSTYVKLDSAYVRTGKVRMLYVNLPLPMHNQAYAAAKAAMCAGVQGKFWQMHDRLFGNQRDWAEKTDAAQTFARYAVDLNLDAAQFRDCYDNDRTAPLITSDIAQASASGVSGTPTFIVNGRQVLTGAIPFSQLSQALDQAISGAVPPPPTGNPGAAPSGQPPVR